MIPVRTHTFVIEWDKDPKPPKPSSALLACAVCVCVCMALPFSAHSVCHDKYICLCFTGWHRLWLAGTAVLAPGPWACVCAQPSDSFHGSLHPRSPHPPSSPLQKSSQAGAATGTPYPLWVLLSGPSLYCPPPLSLDLLSRMRATALHYLLLRLSPFCFTSQRMEWGLPTHHAFFYNFNYDFVIVSATPGGVLSFSSLVLVDPLIILGDLQLGGWMGHWSLSPLFLFLLLSLPLTPSITQLESPDWTVKLQCYWRRATWSPFEERVIKEISS